MKLKNNIPFLIALLLFACCGVHGVNTDEVKLKQKNKALIAGVSKAVCYSGFRTGQHPDRGEGAVNPSDAEILEDLQLLIGAGFSLIRLYDCGENSEKVLRIIKNEKLDIKVMLGIWLRAEFSNHKSCAWLTEPIPQSELENNKKLNLAEIGLGIELANTYAKIVVALNVGNEALVDWNDHKVPVETMRSYVRQVKGATKQLVTIAEITNGGQHMVRKLLTNWIFWPYMCTQFGKEKG